MEITAPVRVKGVVTVYDSNQRCTAQKEKDLTLGNYGTKSTNT